MTSIEDSFITRDMAPVNREVTFKMIEDEDGGTFWGYGHVDPGEFVCEVMNWLIHIGAGPEPGEPHPSGVMEQGVEHLWANYENEGDERFGIIDLDTFAGGGATFPVTRLVL